jgi:hypothetical protein
MNLLLMIMVFALGVALAKQAISLIKILSGPLLYAFKAVMSVLLVLFYCGLSYMIYAAVVA